MDIVKYINARIEGNSVAEIKKKDNAEILLCSALLHGEEKKSNGQCLNFDEAVYYADKGIDVDSDKLLTAHISECAECRAMIREIIEASRRKNIKLSENLRSVNAKERSFPKFSFSFDIKKYLAPALVILVFAVVAYFAADGMFGSGDDLEEFKVKTDSMIVKAITDEDVSMIQTDSVSYKKDQESGYSITKDKMIRAGYVFFMIQNSGERIPVYEDILSRDISRSGEVHMNLAVAVGQKDFYEVFEELAGIGNDMKKCFIQGYAAAYLVYKIKEKKEADDGVSAAESFDLDSKSKVEKLLDKIDDEEDYSAELFEFRNAVFSLSLK
ncbi:MAG: hypothetical protein KAZ87_06930 [Spirochaetes bacterium]|nr:hypothetical protein [Spirochaetota bacterium]